VVGVGRDPRGPSVPAPLLRRGHPERVAQVSVRAAFVCLQGRRLRSVSGQPVAVLGHPHGDEVGFPAVQR